MATILAALEDWQKESYSPYSVMPINVEIVGNQHPHINFQINGNDN